MKRFKKILPAAMMAVALMAGAPAMHGEALVGQPEILPASAVQTLQGTIPFSGVILEILKEDSKATGILVSVAENSHAEMQFNLSDQTAVIDYKTGFAASLSEAEAGDRILVVASPACTYSIPPQCAAYVVLTNVDEEASVKLLEIGEILKKANGDYVIQDSNHEYIVTATDQTEMLPYRTKQVLLAESLEKGNRILVWSDVMTLSLPAQMAADRIVLLPVGEQTGEWQAESGHEKQSAGAGEEMLPLRTIAESLGFKVKWTGQGQRVDLVRGAQTFTMNIGSYDYGVQKMRCVLKTAPEIREGRTFVPRAFFSELMQIKGEIESDN